MKINVPFSEENMISEPDRCEDDDSGLWPKAIPASDMTSSPKNLAERETSEMPPAWSVEHEPARLFYSPELASACRSVNGALTRREGGITMLAVPVSSDEPFPMLPVFCFGEPWIIGGRDYIVFRIKNGELFTD